MLVNGLSDGPAMVLSPPREHAFAQFPSPVLDPPASNYASNPSPVLNGFRANPPTSNSSSTFQYIPKPSRKRSRDEAAFDEAIETSNPPATPPAPPQEEPIYGEGMVLLNPGTDMAISAESQTGTWYEETAENAAATAPPVSSRSKALSNTNVPGRKSQRLDTSAPGLDDIALSSMHQRLQNTTDDNHRTLNPGTGSPNEPLVDDATHLLGISWQRIGEDDDMAAAVRGWKKFIDNQYSAHLRDSRIIMKNRALNAFLVSAHPAHAAVPISPFYLFTEDLTQGQLVGSTWEIALQNLRSTPITFEGAEILQATGQPVQSSETILNANPSEPGLPLLQALSAQPVNGTEMNAGMEIDS